MRSSRIGALGEQRVSPVPASRSPMATTMLPAPARSMRSRRLACTENSRATFSLRRVRAFWTSSLGLEHARVDAQVDRLAPFVHGDLERQRAERRRVVGRAAHRLLGAGHDALDRRHLDRRRQVVADGVQQRLHALVAQRRAREHRHDAAVDRPLAQRRLQHRLVDRLPFEEGVGDGVVEVGGGLDQLLARGGDLVGHRRRRIVLARALGLVAREVERAHAHQIDDAGEAILGADRQLDRDRARAEPRADLLDARRESRRRRGPSC